MRVKPVNVPRWDTATAYAISNSDGVGVETGLLFKKALGLKKISEVKKIFRVKNLLGPKRRVKLNG